MNNENQINEQNEMNDEQQAPFSNTFDGQANPQQAPFPNSFEGQGNPQQVPTDPFAPQVNPTFVGQPEQQAPFPNTFVNSVNVQQPMQQNPFGAQGMMQKQVKKPMKIGWIISLTILMLSIIASVTGGVMLGMGFNTIKENIGKDNEMYTRTTIDPETYIYEGLTPGKEYFIVLSQAAGPEITGVSVDGKNISSSLTQSGGTNSKTSILKVYRFIAKSDEVTVELNGVTKKTEAKIGLLDGAKYGNAITQATVGIFLLVFGIFIVFISGVIFIVFLIIFLVKNSKYKNARRYASMM